MLGSDTSDKQMEVCRFNMNNMMMNLGLEDLQPAGEYEFMGSSKYPIFNYGRWLKLANCNFDRVKEDINLNNFDIFTNPPFTSDNTNESLPSVVHRPGSGKNKRRVQKKNSLAKKNIELEQNYAKFDKFVTNQRTTLGSVYILYPLKLKSKMYHYVAESDLAWTCVDTLVSGGFRLGLWKCEKLLKSEKDMFLEYLVSFLNTRSDLHNSDMKTVYDVLKSDLEDAEQAYLDYLKGQFKEIYSTWRFNKFGVETQTFNVNVHTKEELLNPTLDVKQEVTDLVKSNDIEQFSELATLD